MVFLWFHFDGGLHFVLLYLDLRLDQRVRVEVRWIRRGIRIALRRLGVDVSNDYLTLV